MSSECTVGYLALIISDVQRCISTQGTECSFTAHICIKNLFTANLMQLITCVTNNSLVAEENKSWFQTALTSSFLFPAQLTVVKCLTNMT